MFSGVHKYNLKLNILLRKNTYPINIKYIIIIINVHQSMTFDYNAKVVSGSGHEMFYMPWVDNGGLSRLPWTIIDNFKLYVTMKKETNCKKPSGHKLLKSSFLGLFSKTLIVFPFYTIKWLALDCWEQCSTYYCSSSLTLQCTDLPRVKHCHFELQKLLQLN